MSEKVVINNIYDLVEKTCRENVKKNNLIPGNLRNQYYRGLALKLTPTEISARIKNYLFEDLFIGDVIETQITTSKFGTITLKSVIAGFNCGCMYLTIPHIILISQDILYKTKLHGNNSAMSYTDTILFQEEQASIGAAINTSLSGTLIRYSFAFPKMTTTSKEIVSGGYGGWKGASSGWEVASIIARPLSILEVWNSNSTISSCVDTWKVTDMLPLFKLNPKSRYAYYVNNNPTGSASYWHYNIGSVNSFCYTDLNCVPYVQAQNLEAGVRFLYVMK